MGKYYVTTPIFYINDKPHIGHAYTMMAADIVARYQALLGKNVFFLTGTDENSQKTVEKAQKENKSPRAYSDAMAEEWGKTWAELGIRYSRFIRTTEDAHSRAVQDVIQKIHDCGDVYKKAYRGLYCRGCEEFKTPKDLKNGNACPLHNIVCEQIEEENYFFRLSKYRGALLAHIEKHPEFIEPEARRNEITSFLKGEVDDISISRPGASWGIPIPFDNSHRVYVWVDALINYLSGVGYPDEEYKKYWPADAHLIGKDIIRFHCVIWPAVLLSAGAALPRTIFAHGFFTVDGQKISKSLGNAISPLDIAGKYGVEALRYYLFSDISFGGDGDFSEKRLVERFNGDLSDNVGNAVSRVLGMAAQHRVSLQIKQESFVEASSAYSTYKDAMDRFAFMDAVGILREACTKLNQKINAEKPWAMGDSPEALKKTLSGYAQILYSIGVLLEPFLPESSQKIRSALAKFSPEMAVSAIFPRLSPHP